MKLGFIGTGQIAKATILGILGSNLKVDRIYISQRNMNISRQLSKKSKKISILKDNQEIINKSNWVFLSITPNVGNKILKDLKFKPSQTIINFISTIGMSQLKKYIKVKYRCSDRAKRNFPRFCNKKYGTALVFRAVSNVPVQND